MEGLQESPSPAPFARTPLPPKFCNLDRLLHGLEARGLDGIIATSSRNLFYLTSFNGVAHKSDEPRPYAFILSRQAPLHPILVIADYYLASFLKQPTWVEDLRPFRAVMMGLDLAPSPDDIGRFIPPESEGTAWLEQARSNFSYDMGSAVKRALKDLGLEGRRLAIDDIGLGQRLGLEGVELVDGYDPMMFARAVKTETELTLMERATRLNQMAIEQTVAAWQKGMTWRQLNETYHRAVVALGGFVRDPGGMVWGHPRGPEHTLMLQTGLEDFEVEAGCHVMFDCHGTLDLYCWDGGKTWVVDAEPEGVGKRYLEATSLVAQELLHAMRPGIRNSELQALGRNVYRKAGAPDGDAAVIFFHGLGLSHMELEQRTTDGQPNGDWALEDGMVVPLHLLYPGSDRERAWLEEVVVVTPDGGRPLFTWGYGALTGN